MNEKKLLFFKGLLEERLRLLLEEAGKMAQDMRENQNVEFPDPTDRASLESDRNFLLRIKDRERKLITKVTETLDRIDNGSFGVCESCGKPISEKRLIVRPVTTQCIACKTEQEKSEQLQSMRKKRAKKSFPS
ncbi:MAG: RNA polymerase-binding protein DksA [Deltaproteobacteria bacterium RBG_13_53_10]|nr:MAG: RNA polymerase-binding protein DksA [Deltaproteobacteria bacterium RBG_13_53_10]